MELDDAPPSSARPEPGETFDVDVGPEPPKKGEPQYDEDLPNLVEAFMATEDGRKSLRDIADRVFRDFEADWDASENYRKQMADDLRLFSGDLPKKEYPHRDAANMHVPIMLENMSRLSFRTEAEVFSDWSQFFEYQPQTEDDRQMAETVTRHSNWQFCEKFTDFPRQMSRAILMFYVNGDVTCHSYWDPERRRNVHEVLTPDEFVTPYVYTTVEPDYSDLPHYTKVFRRFRHQMEAMQGIWFDVDKVLDKLPPSFDSEPDAPIRESRAQVEQIDQPDDATEAAPYKLLWYEGWLKLPVQDRERWCQVILDHATKCILSLRIHEEIDGADQLRYETQLGEGQVYVQQAQARIQAAKQAEMVQQQNQPFLADPMVGPQAAMEIQQAIAQVPPEPQLPTWAQDEEELQLGPVPPRKVPIYMFAHGVCIEPLTGNLGLSYGRIQSDFNRAADTALNQATDSATLANCKSFLTTENVELDKPIEIRPGAFNKVPGVMPGQLESSIMPLQFGEPSPALFQAVDRMYGYGQTSVQAPGVLSGESGKSGETYRGISARIEQATKQLSVAARKFSWIFLRQIIRNNAKLNATFMPEEEMFSRFDQETGKYSRNVARRSDYAQAYQVAMSSDLRFASTSQKIAEADEIAQMPQAFPPLQGNLLFQYHALVNVLKQRGVCDMVQFLGAPPPPVPAYGLPSPALMMMQGMGPPGPGGPPGGPPGPGGQPPGLERPGAPPKPEGIPGPRPENAPVQ